MPAFRDLPLLLAVLRGALALIRLPPGGAAEAPTPQTEEHRHG